MLSLPDDWDYTIAGLSTSCKDGVDSIRSAIVELEKAGYMKRSRVRSGNGTYGGTEYIVREYPVVEEPIQENPIQVNPMQEERPQINTYIPSTNQKSTKKQNTNKQTENEKTNREEKFNQFWEQYPKKVSKQATIKSWEKLKPDELLFNQIMQALEIQKRTEQWQNPQYIPNPATWLNGRRWEDEVKPKEEEKKPIGNYPNWNKTGGSWL